MYKLIITLCCILIVGCSTASQPTYSGVMTPVQLTSSRVLMPPSGGQTIQPPVLMGDAYTLWSPLSKQERQRTSFIPRYAKYQPDDTKIDWLPASEKHTMQNYLYRLVENRRSLTLTVLARANKYLPNILETIHAQGLPTELACLPLIESAFQPHAISSAGAAGLWQLMPATAKQYGLTVTKDLDERFDVKKSTQAAVAYLAYLYQYFGDWPLALAAYNFGEGNIQRVSTQSGQRTLKGLMQWMKETNTNLLPDETRQFVPSFAAAIVIMSQTDTLNLATQPLLLLNRKKTAPHVAYGSPLPNNFVYEQTSSLQQQSSSSAIPSSGSQRNSLQTDKNSLPLPSKTSSPNQINIADQNTSHIHALQPQNEKIVPKSHRLAAKLTSQNQQQSAQAPITSPHSPPLAQTTSFASNTPQIKQKPVEQQQMTALPPTLTLPHSPHLSKQASAIQPQTVNSASTPLPPSTQNVKSATASSKKHTSAFPTPERNTSKGKLKLRGTIRTNTPISQTPPSSIRIQ